MVEPSATEHPLIGQTLNGRYRVSALIGTGGMSAVYRAEHVQLGRSVALKVLNAEMATHREAMLRFEREALVSAKIQHPNVVSATDSGRLRDGSLYLVLELVEGRSLRDLITSEGQLPMPRALSIATQIADALDAAHRAGVIHRDLKPSNVMLLARDGHTDFVKVLDFGLARAQGATSAGEALTQSGRIFGTPEYMAPEQARGEKVDERGDIYALGVILYELLAGRPPFESPELMALLIKHIQEAPPPLPAEVPQRLARYVMTLLEKEPDQRPKSARQVSKALSKLALPQVERSTRPPEPAASTVPAAAAPASVRRQPRRLLVPVGVIAALASAGIFWLGRPERSTEPQPSAPAAQVDAPSEAAEPSALPVPPAVAPPRPDGSAELARGVQLAGSGQFGEALSALNGALDIDPGLRDSPELLAAVRRAADAPATRDRALELAAKRLGASGADLLYDVWSSTSGKTPATRAARKWLDAPAVRARAQPATLLALEIREAKTCSAVRSLLPSMAEHGDERSLSPLRRYRATNGCGFLGFGDCHKCLRRDSSLEKAIAAVGKREAPRFALK
jgi:hypothetical protein